MAWEISNRFVHNIPCLQKSIAHKNQLAISILIALSFLNSYDLKCLDFSICISVLLVSSKKIQKSCRLLPIRCPGKFQFIQACQGIVGYMRNFQTFWGSLTWLFFLCHINLSCSLPEILSCGTQLLTVPWTGCSNVLTSCVMQEGWKT